MKKIFTILTFLLGLNLSMFAQVDCPFKTEEGVVLYFSAAAPNATITGHTPSAESATVITIPETINFEGDTYTVTGIRSSALSGLSNLVTLSLPETITKIGEKAFENCVNLKSVNIPGGVKTIGRCLTLPSDGKVPAMNAFKGCTNIETLVLGEGVESVGYYVFDSCDKIKNLTLPSTLKECIGLNNLQIEELIFPDGMRTVGGFENCPNLKSVFIPKTVDYILTAGKIGYNNDYNSQNLSILNNRTFFLSNEIESLVIDSDNPYYSSYDSNIIVRKEDNYLIAGTNYTTSIPNGVKTIGLYSFYNCDKIRSIDIPNSVEYAEVFAFQHCTNLERVSVGTGMLIMNLACTYSGVHFGPSDTYTTNSDYYTFAYCPNLKVLTLNCNEINPLWYTWWNPLEELRFGEDVNEIVWNDRAFQSTVNKIVSLSKTPKSFNSKCFSKDTYENTPLYVPNDAYTTYRQTDGWKEFKRKRVIHNENDPSITFIAKDCSRYYGDKNPYFGYDVSDYDVHVDGSPELSCEATETSVVGDYPIIIAKGTVENYNDTYVNGTLTVTKAPLIITPNSITIKQGEEIPSLTLNYEGFKNNETEEVLTKKPTITTTATSGSKPGTYDITVSGAEAQNYEFSYMSGTLTIEPGIYKLTYMVDGETYKSYDLEYGATITPEPSPTKDGYTFSGWSEIPETMPDHDVTITGTFSINKYKLIYTVDGEEYKSYDVEYGASITLEPAPTKDGYTFSGWSEIPETMPAHDVIVTGTFTINKYKLTYTVDGEEYKIYDVEYGSTITPEPAPSKEGYTFSGWSEIPETMPANDVTVTGTFSVNKYKLVYMVDGEEYKTYEMEYGATITPEPVPTKDGYTFSGWSDIPEMMPDHDVTVTGTFTINSYKLTYMIDNQVYKEIMYEYGATITPEPQPEGDYATFEWIDLPEKMPAHDVVVYASYTSGINEVLMTTQRNIRIYSPNGKKLDKMQKGLNIVVQDDGTVKKVVMK